MKKEYIRWMAEAERLMDEGKLPFVMAPTPNGRFERMSVNPDIMEDLGLKSGQTVNSFIVDAISQYSIELLLRNIDEIKQEYEESLLQPDFDYRELM